MVHGADYATMIPSMKDAVDNLPVFAGDSADGVDFGVPHDKSNKGKKLPQINKE